MTPVIPANERRTELYRYDAVTAAGRRVSGTVHGASLSAVRAVVRARGEYLLTAERVPVLLASLRHQVPLEDLAGLLRGLGTILAAGVPLRHAPSALAPLVSARGARCIPELEQGIAEGAPLSDALSRSCGGLPMGLAALMNAGERSGNQAAALMTAADVLDERIELRRAVLSALAYPALLTVAAVLVVALLVMVVLPRFAALLSDLGNAVPASTQFLLQVAHWCAVMIPGATVLAALGAVALWRFAQHPQRKARLHAAALSVPVIGALRHSLTSVRAGRLLAAAVKARLPLADGLRLAAIGAGDAEVAHRLERACARVLEGESLTDALVATAALSGSMVRLVGIGELSGDVACALAQAATLEAAAARQRIRAGVALIQPVLIVLLGGLVTFVAIAMLQAMYSVRPTG